MDPVTGHRRILDLMFRNRVVLYLTITLLSIADGKTAFHLGLNKPQYALPSTSLNKYAAYKDASNKPIISIAESKSALRSGSLLTTPTKQPAYNPFYNARKKRQITSNISGTLIEQSAYETGAKSQTSSVIDMVSQTKQPAYNPYYNHESNFGTKIGSNIQPHKAGYNPIINRTSILPNYGFNPKSSNNIGHSADDKNQTLNLEHHHRGDDNNIQRKNKSFKQAKILHYSGNRALSHSSKLGLLGYPTSTIHQHNLFKTQQYINRKHIIEKSSYAKNQIIIIVALLIVIIAIVIGIIVYKKMK
ncbi:uncharacterized protein LOC119609325 [Lucilia sericata]|uniref:uncharacterized protein LOC119609325 n=1 Tax=Lucilia sericata TaxID=13632 RepID=UPI0018A8823F|nr:uncharacterized protein LOC119609325 [Lucilia sericata]